MSEQTLPEEKIKAEQLIPVSQDFATRLPADSLDPVSHDALDKFDADTFPVIGVIRFFASLKYSPKFIEWFDTLHTEYNGIKYWMSGKYNYSESVYSDFVNYKSSYMAINFPDAIQPEVIVAIEKLFNIAKSEMEEFSNYLLEVNSKSYLRDYFPIIADLRSITKLIYSQKPMLYADFERLARRKVMSRHGISNSEEFSRRLATDTNLKSQYNRDIQNNLLTEIDSPHDSINYAIKKISELKSRVGNCYTKLYTDTISEILDQYGFIDQISFVTIGWKIPGVFIQTSTGFKNHIDQGEFKFVINPKEDRSEFSDLPIGIKITGKDGFEFDIEKDNKTYSAIDSKSLVELLKSKFLALGNVSPFSRNGFINNEAFFTTNQMLNILAELEVVYTKLSNTEYLLTKYNTIPDTFTEGELIVKQDDEYILDHPAKSLFLDVFNSSINNKSLWNSLVRGVDIDEPLKIGDLKSEGLSSFCLNRLTSWNYLTRLQSALNNPNYRYQMMRWIERGGMDINFRGFVVPFETTHKAEVSTKKRAIEIKNEVNEILAQTFGKATKESSADKKDILNSRESAINNPQFIITTPNILQRSDILPIKYLAFPSEDIQETSEYQKYDLPQNTSDFITIKSQKPAEVVKDKLGNIILQLYGVPYSKLTGIKINDGTDLEYSIGKDYEVQYDKKFGYYRLVFSKDSNINDTDKFYYEFTVDSKNNNESAPVKAQEISLSLLERQRLSEIAKEITKLRYTEIGKALGAVASKMGKATTKQIEDAIRKASIYSFSDVYSKDTLKEAEQVLNTKFSFLPAPRNDGKVAIICSHAATLTSIIFSEIFPDSNFYPSNLLPVYDLALGVKVVGGVGHSDTRGVKENQYIVNDATPKSNFMFDIQQLLTSLKNETIGKIKTKQRVVTEIAGKIINKEKMNERNKKNISVPLSEDLAEKEKRKYILGKLPSLINTFQEGYFEREGITKNDLRVKYPEGITKVGKLLETISRESELIYSNEEKRNEVKLQISELLQEWQSIEKYKTDPSKERIFKTYYGNASNYPNFILNILRDTQLAIDLI
ncbi:MAG: hypothetical protein WCK31_00175 [bacterium]